MIMAQYFYAQNMKKLIWNFIAAHRQVSHRYHALDIEGGAIRVLISSEGVMHIKLKTLQFADKVRKCFFLLSFNFTVVQDLKTLCS